MNYDSFWVNATDREINFHMCTFTHSTFLMAPWFSSCCENACQISHSEGVIFLAFAITNWLPSVPATDAASLSLTSSLWMCRSQSKPHYSLCWACSMNLIWALNPTYFPSARVLTCLSNISLLYLACSPSLTETCTLMFRAWLFQRFSTGLPFSN